MKSEHDLLVMLFATPWGQRFLMFLTGWVLAGNVFDLLFWRHVSEPTRRRWERDHTPWVGVARIILAGAMVRQAILAAVFQVGKRKPKWGGDGRPTLAPSVPPTPVVVPSVDGQSGK